MTNSAQSADCWCCGAPASEDRLVRLGARPEAAVCLDCAADVRRRARERVATAPGRRLHEAADHVRGAVMSRGWHEQPRLGAVLKRINRSLPW